MSATERVASKLRECVTISGICRYQAGAVWQAAEKSVKRRCWVDNHAVQCVEIQYMLTENLVTEENTCIFRSQTEFQQFLKIPKSRYRKISYIGVYRVHRNTYICI